jgi:hypothetical protein
MPSAAETFQNMAPPQGPFSEMLSAPLVPRPIDTMQQQFTGHESGPVGGGKIALQFLQGIRERRRADFLEDDKNRQVELDNYRNYVNQRLQDPDLTEEGRRAIIEEGNRTLNTHMQYEMRDLKDNDGVAGFFKKILVHAAGGPIKTRQPINFDEATGRIAKAAMGHSQKAIFEAGVKEAMQKVTEMRQAGASPRQVQAALSEIGTRIAAGAPAYAEAFAYNVGPLAKFDPFTEEVNRQLYNRARQLGGAAPTAPALSAPATAPPPEAPVAQARPDVPDFIRLGPGVGAPVEVPAMVQVPHKFVPDIRPAETRAAASPTGPVPSASGLGDLDLRNPVDRMILGKFGYKVGEPVTLYDLSDQAPPIPNVIYHPGRGAYVDAATNEPVDARNMIPHDQVRRPQVSQDVLLFGSPGDPAGDPRAILGNKAAGTGRVLLVDGKPVYGTGALMDVPAEGGAVRGTRGQAAGTERPLTPDQQIEAQTNRAVEQAMQAAGRNPILALDALAADKNLSDDLKTRARRSLESTINSAPRIQQFEWTREKRKSAKGAKGGAATPPAPAPAPAPGASAAAAPPPSTQYRLR